MFWTFVKRSTYENVKSRMSNLITRIQYLRLQLKVHKKGTSFADSVLEGVYKKLWEESIAHTGELEFKLRRLEQTISRHGKEEMSLIECFNCYFPVSWNSEKQRGYIATHVCPGTGCEKPHQLTDTYNSFSDLVGSLVRRISDGERPISELCHRCAPFEVFECDNGRWRVVTQICQFGGCDADWAEFDTEEEAKLYATRIYEQGQRISYHGLCPQCADEYREMCM